MRVSKWGNSLAVRLPTSVVQSLMLKEGDTIELHVLGARDLAVKRTPASAELLERLHKYRGRLPDGFRFDRLDANEGD